MEQIKMIGREGFLNDTKPTIYENEIELKNNMNSYEPEFLEEYDKRTNKTIYKLYVN